MLHTYILLQERQPRRVYNKSMLLSVIFVLSFLPQLFELYVSAERGSFSGTRLKAYLDIAELAIAAIGAGVCILVPQRPAVFHHGQPVDGYNTAHAWSSSTYGWVLPLMALSRDGKKQDFDDLPVLIEPQRAGYLYEKFLEASYTGHLAMQLVRYHAWGIAYQWGLTVGDGLCSLGPQLSMFQLLRILEARDAGVPVIYTAAFWVVALGVTQLISGYFSNRLWFVRVHRIFEFSFNN
jgi:hypothetical protein